MKIHGDYGGITLVQDVEVRYPDVFFFRKFGMYFALVPPYDKGGSLIMDFVLLAERDYHRFFHS